MTLNAGGGTFDTNGNDATLGGTIIGIGPLTKIGAGTLTLTGANIYSGGTTISGGTLQIGSGGPTGSIVGDIVNNAALTFNRSDDLAFSGAISGTGSLTKIGIGTLTLSGGAGYVFGVTTGGQCRHAAGRSGKCIFGRQRVHGRLGRHPRPRELQPDHRLARGRRQRDAWRCHGPTTTTRSTTYSGVMFSGGA